MVQAGADGCRGGWIAAIAENDTPPEFRVFGQFAALVDALPGDALIAVDMPIGLPERCGPGGRGPEKLVRPLLGMRQSSVFSIPSRSAVYSGTAPASTGHGGWLAAHQRASAVARDTSDPPRGVSIQAFGLYAKIRELDTMLRENLSLRGRIFESHPELCFWRMNGRRPLGEPKKVKGAVYAPGLAERRRLLVRAGFDAESVAAPPPAGAAQDDLLDALAVLTAARNRRSGNALMFPDPPLLDSYGLPIAISC